MCFAISLHYSVGETKNTHRKRANNTKKKKTVFETENAT
jgi:hypothetical protein